tara:strand:- start:158 stop:634 length:477 start_codon:yes stop_codon:yes gene_type:complete
MSQPIGEGYTGSAVATKTNAPTWVYSDLGFDFKPSPFFVREGLSGDVVRVYDRSAIKQSIRNIVLTNRYERPFKPDFGCNLRQFLFEPLGAWDVYEMETVILDQLALYEPRIQVLKVEITEDITILTVNVRVEYEVTPISGSIYSDSVEILIRTERVR